MRTRLKQLFWGSAGVGAVAAAALTLTAFAEENVAWERAERDDKPDQWTFCAPLEDGLAHCHAVGGDAAPEALGRPGVFALKLGPRENWKDALEPLGEKRKAFGIGHVLNYQGDAYLKLTTISKARSGEAWNFTSFTADCAEALGAPGLVAADLEAPAFSMDGAKAFGAEADDMCLSFEDASGCLAEGSGFQPNYYNECYVAARLEAK
ncbi:MAG: hypothetical protein AAF527_11225 [Pseudomonadota bacterium]